jgi:hypothetical protein
MAQKWRKPELAEEMLGCLKKGKSARKLVVTFVARLLTAQAARLRDLWLILVGLPGVEPGTNGL